MNIWICNIVTAKAKAKSTSTEQYIAYDKTCVGRVKHLIYT